MTIIETQNYQIQEIVDTVNFKGRSLLSINDLQNDQIYALFKLARVLETWNRSIINLVPGQLMTLLFFQPSTRTRMSFETAMLRLGGLTITETTPLISSSAAKEESLDDMLKVVSKYANLIVIRHFNDQEALSAVKFSEVPVINGGFGHWEHPTQALLDLYTLWRTYNRIEGLRVCVASPDLVEARTGHSMACGLARLGARVTLASSSARRIPDTVLNEIKRYGADYEEVFDLNQDGFNELITNMDMIYLPGCSAPKGTEAEAFKKSMDNYFVRFETLDQVYQRQGRIIYVTHTLPRRAGEMDLRIDPTPNQLYFEAITHSISIRMALIASILGVDQHYLHT
jgi:aspartate carbamoyltransferase catalytic subunit